MYTASNFILRFLIQGSVDTRFNSGMSSPIPAGHMWPIEGLRCSTDCDCTYDPRTGPQYLLWSFAI